jgi:hypothetical protein
MLGSRPSGEVGGLSGGFHKEPDSAPVGAEGTDCAVTRRSQA